MCYGLVVQNLFRIYKAVSSFSTSTKINKISKIKS